MMEDPFIRRLPVAADALPLLDATTRSLAMGGVVAMLDGSIVDSLGTGCSPYT